MFAWANAPTQRGGYSAFHDSGIYEMAYRTVRLSESVREDAARRRKAEIASMGVT